MYKNIFFHIFLYAEKNGGVEVSTNSRNVNMAESNMAVRAISIKERYKHIVVVELLNE